MVILIESKSTHNFLDPSIIKRAQLMAKRWEDIKIRVANGELITSERRSEGLRVYIQGNNFLTDTYVSTFASCDMVLGIFWLRTLGQILWNFSELTLKYSLQGRKVRLQGMNPIPLMEEGEIIESIGQARKEFSCS